MEQFHLADLCDANEEVVRVLEPGYHSYGARHAFHGAICTLKCHEDNSLVGEVLSEPGAGRVLVVDGGGSLRRALVGGNLAARAADNGWSGILVHGAVRDVHELADIDVGIRALGTTPLRSEKRGVGQLGVALQFAGVYLLPDQLLYADADGILISPVAIHD